MMTEKQKDAKRDLEPTEEKTEIQKDAKVDQELKEENKTRIPYRCQQFLKYYGP